MARVNAAIRGVAIRGVAIRGGAAEQAGARQKRARLRAVGPRLPASESPKKYRRKRVCLLGGSFDPPHRGHLYISQQARRRLRAVETWWLVTPQNPLKQAPSQEIAARICRARAWITTATASSSAHHIRIIEAPATHGVAAEYSTHTIKTLLRRFPRHQFVWVIGADSWKDFHKWFRYDRIMQQIRVVIAPRSGYESEIVLARTARRFSHRRYPHAQACGIWHWRPPVWVALRFRAMDISSTALRRTPD